MDISTKSDWVKKIICKYIFYKTRMNKKMYKNEFFQCKMFIILKYLL